MPGCCFNNAPLSLSQLPSLPTAVGELLKLFTEQDAHPDSLRRIVDVVRQDVVLTARMLRCASDVHGGHRRFSRLEDAAEALGWNGTTAVALRFALSESAANECPDSQHYLSFWRQSWIRAASASALAKHCPDVDPSEAFTLGLLLKIGRLQLLESKVELFVDRMHEARERGLTLEAIEAECLEITSTDSSLCLLEQVRLPEHCELAVRWQSEPLGRIMSNRSSTKEMPLALVLRIANTLANYLSGEESGLALVTAYETMWRLLKIPYDVAHKLVLEIQRDMAVHSALFCLDSLGGRTSVDLMNDAIEVLSQTIAESASVASEAEDVGSLEREQRELQKQIQGLTLTTTRDPLTGLYKRDCLLEQLDVLAAWSFRTGQSFGVLFLDVDNFKQVNDDYGHLIGDQILRDFSRVLQKCVPSPEMVGRYGGEEFVVLCFPKHPEDLLGRAEEIRNSIDEMPLEIEGTPLKVTVSIGGAMGIADSATDLFQTRLLQAADEAMYRSKTRGGNQATLANGDGWASQQGEAIQQDCCVSVRLQPMFRSH
jgi:diguanylate cyclase (GGDEF)-like protein